MDLAAARNRLDFAKATRTPGALDHRVAADVRAFGVDGGAFEILDRLEITAYTRDDRLPAVDGVPDAWRPCARVTRDGAILARGPQ